MQLNPQHLTVDQLLAGRLFRIPDYQRAYSWQTKQRRDLFNDIEVVVETGCDHFMATVVGLGGLPRNIGSRAYKRVDLVDGQQRVTTLVILLKAIEKALNAEDAGRDKRDLQELLVKDDRHSVVLLQTNHDSSDIFVQYVRTGEPVHSTVATASDRNILDCIKECEGFVAQWAARMPLLDLLSAIRNKLSMIYHEISDEAVVYRVFEVLNSRGLDVKWVDKTKSRLMASIFDNVAEDARGDSLHEMHVVWKDIYRALGLDQKLGDEALTFAGTWKLATRPRRILSEEESSNELVRTAGTEIGSIMEIARWLRYVVDKVVLLDGDKRRSAISRVRQARFVAIAILLRAFPENVEQELIAAWERVTFRIYTLSGADTRKRVGEYVELGYDIVRNSIDPEEIRARLREIGKGFSIDEVISVETWEEWYGNWAGEARYLLFRYEEHLAREAGHDVDPLVWGQIWTEDPAKSIEHVSPRSAKEPWAHHLGNLTMLPPRLNSKLGDRPPADKASAYLTSGIKATAAIGRKIEEGLAWDEEAVQIRANAIEAFARIEWAD